MKRIAVYALVAWLGCTHAIADESRAQWPIAFWQGFIATSANDGLPKAFGSDRFPLLETLIKLPEAHPTQIAALEQWLGDQMREHFVANKRDQAYVYKGFLTCIKSGACYHLTKLDPRSNAGAEPFEPDLTERWYGNGRPAGRIDWSAGNFAYLGRMEVIDEYWDEQRGGYVMLLIRTFRPSYGDRSKVSRFTIEITFFSPCTFTGFESRSYTEIEVGGHCPERN